MNREIRRAFDEAAGTLIVSFEKSGPFPGQEVTPPLLADAVRQCLDIRQRLEATDDLMPPEDLDEIGTHALECLSDLSLWAFQLKLDAVRAVIEDLALDMAGWIAQRSGQVAVLEPVVNAIARKANATQEPAALAALFDQARNIVTHAAPAVADATDMAALQPWLTLNFNCAIVATRTQQPELMNAAYDLLESYLPQQCVAFYEEGLRESQKTVYGAHVREMIGERLTKWTSRH